jgi:hypothetical protein
VHVAYASVSISFKLTLLGAKKIVTTSEKTGLSEKRVINYERGINRLMYSIVLAECAGHDD